MGHQLNLFGVSERICVGQLELHQIEKAGVSRRRRRKRRLSAFLAIGS